MITAFMEAFFFLLIPSLMLSFVFSIIARIGAQVKYIVAITTFCGAILFYSYFSFIAFLWDGTSWFTLKLSIIDLLFFALPSALISFVPALSRAMWLKRSKKFVKQYTGKEFLKTSAVFILLTPLTGCAVVPLIDYAGQFF